MGGEGENVSAGVGYAVWSGNGRFGLRVVALWTLQRPLCRPSREGRLGYQPSSYGTLDLPANPSGPRVPDFRAHWPTPVRSDDVWPERTHLNPTFLAAL
jgi:hypothetical protein